MITTVLAAIWRFIPLKGPEGILVLVGLLAVGFIWYQGERHDRMEQTLTITETALAGAKLVVERQQQQKAIDADIITDYVTQRDTYRDQQTVIAQTTVLDFLHLPTPEDPAHVPAAPSPATPPSSDPQVVPVSLSVDQLSVLARGMWDSYCHTAPTATGCPAADTR